MNENKNLNISSISNVDVVEHDINLASDVPLDCDNPDELYDDYMYDETYYNSICMSCQHWNGYMCNAENSNCNY